MRIIYWIRRDLRLSDNPALNWAAANSAELYPLYIHAPHEDAPWEPGAASNWWLHHSLQRLQSDYQRNGQQLILRSGDSLQVLQDLIQQTGADTVVWNRLYEPASIKRDKQIKAELRKRALSVHSFKAQLLIEPWDIETAAGEPYRVFTPYFKKTRQLPQDLSISSGPALPPQRQAMESDGLGRLDLVATHPWVEKLAQHWQPGEDRAHQLLDDFCEQALSEYAHARNVPAKTGTSKLSPYLHFGEISPRQILAGLGAAGEASEAYVRELYWREFSHHLLFHFPHTTDQAFMQKFSALKWRRGGSINQELRLWQRGETGIDLVDAGMRELWATGWMHNRVRMIVASLLTKNLGIHWLEGARWFWDTLVDADLANNSMGWQWVAGCGADAAPYFRIFNPDTQADKFDPNGHYRKRWLGDRKLEPIIDLKHSRELALQRYAELS